MHAEIVWEIAERIHFAVGDSAAHLEVSEKFSDGGVGQDAAQATKVEADCFWWKGKGKGACWDNQTRTREVAAEEGAGQDGASGAMKGQGKGLMKGKATGKAWDAQTAKDEAVAEVGAGQGRVGGAMKGAGKGRFKGKCFRYDAQTENDEAIPQ